MGKPEDPIAAAFQALIFAFSRHLTDAQRKDVMDDLYSMETAARGAGHSNTAALIRGLHHSAQFARKRHGEEEAALSGGRTKH